MEGRYLAVALAQGRIAIGGVSLLAPGWTARTMTTWDGPSVFVRMVGARDIGLGLGTLLALWRRAPARGWLEASALVDGLDVAACVLARDHIRSSVFRVPSAWRPPERCSARGWPGGSTRRSQHILGLNAPGRDTACPFPCSSFVSEATIPTRR